MDKSKQVTSRFATKNNKKKTFEIRIPRLILRNLNFKLKEDELKSSLEKYGTVKDLKLPKKADGSPCGYGFVSYASKTEAIEAMKNINNMKEKLLGTRVVVDWCLPKDVYLKSRGSLNIACIGQ
jgi:multiple RNA-binding domain-containing protein 1